MEDTVDLTVLTDELFRRVGRNLLNFQRLEENLRVMAAYSDFDAPLKDAASEWDKHVTDLRTSTMGTVSGRVRKTVLANPGQQEQLARLVEPMISFRATTSMDSMELVRLRDRISELVTERNKLVHHFAGS